MPFARHPTVNKVVAYTSGDGVVLFQEDQAGHEEIDDPLVVFFDKHIEVLSIALTPDEQSLVTGSSDPRIRVWATSTGSSPRQIETGDYSNYTR